MAISSQNVDTLTKEFLSSSDTNMIQDLFNSYNPGYRFAKGSIYYDFHQDNGEGGGKQKSAVAEEKESKNVEDLEKEDSLADVGKCVLIDPDRRDMLCCMHEESTPQEKKNYRYTSNQRAIETKSRKFKRLRGRLKPVTVAVAELSLSVFKFSTFNKDKFHEPIRGIVMRRMLAKEEFKVYLPDGFRTSSLCPICENGELNTFKFVQNPRPFRRRKNIQLWNAMAL